jgi:hypothetical protein
MGKVERRSGGVCPVCDQWRSFWVQLAYVQGQGEDTDVTMERCWECFVPMVPDPDLLPAIRQALLLGGMVEVVDSDNFNKVLGVRRFRFVD